MFEGLEVNTYRGEDGTIVVDLLGPGDEDTTGKGEPDIRVWMNEALIYAHGRVGDDLSNGGEIVAVKVRDQPGNGPEAVFILVYTHKHGEDVSAYRTPGGAETAAFEIAHNRAHELVWHKSEVDRFDAAETPADALAVFHEIELNYNYSEHLEITESQLGD